MGYFNKKNMAVFKVIGVLIMLVSPLRAQFQLPFYDDFNDGDDSDWVWYVSIGPTPGGNPWHGVVNGVEVIRTHDQNATLLANGLSNLADYTVEADARITQILDDAYGGIYVYAYDHGGVSPGCSYYQLNICRRCSRWYLGVRYSDGSGERIAQGYLSVEMYRWYRVKLSVKGDTVSAFLDGQLLGQGVPSHPLEGGYFGFGGADDVIEVDNVSVYSSLTDIQDSISMVPEVQKFDLLNNVIIKGEIKPLKVVSNEATHVDVIFFNVDGQKITQYKKDLIKGVNYLHIPSGVTQSTGIYFLLVKDSRGTVHSLFKVTVYP